MGRTSSDYESLLGLAVEHVKRMAFENAVVEHIDEWSYVEFPDDGVSIASDEFRVLRTAQFYGWQDQEHRRFVGPLPSGLRFTFTRDEARSLLGPPDASGDKRSQLDEVQHSWDRWVISGGRTIHCEYGRAEASIRLVSLSKFG